MKPFDYFRKFLTGLTLVIVAMLLLTWAGVFDSSKRTPPAVMGDDEINLRFKAESGEADALNKLAIQFRVGKTVVSLA